MAESLVTLAQLFLSVVTLVLGIMAVMAWKRRQRAPETPLVAMLIAAAAIYCFGYSQELAQTTLSRALFWLDVEYLGIPWLPAFWVLLARKHNRLSSRVWVLLVIPVVTLVAELTNSYHHLYDRSFDFVYHAPFWVVSAHRGPLAWLNLAYLYGAGIYGTCIYLFRFGKSSSRFRKQSLLFVLSAISPYVGYAIYIVGASPWGLDLAPVTMALSAILGYIAMVRMQCFDLVPMARSLVFNSMRDAVLVTDLDHRLVDWNVAAKGLLQCLGNLRLGADVTSAASQSAVLQRVFREPTFAHSVELRVGGDPGHYEARALPLCMDDEQSGWAVILADMTAQVRLVHELRRDAETDELTGVANRRRFVASIERETARFIRHGAPFSLALVDVDHFKTINDRYGHAAGDKVLSAVVERIGPCLRRGDLLSRYGGDEFAVLLPETGPDGALEAAERMRAVVAGSALDMGDQLIRMSVSIGVATCEREHTEDWVQLLAEADRGLYRAKAAGRNRVASMKRLAAGGQAAIAG